MIEIETIDDLREAIVDRMGDLDITPYKLAQISEINKSIISRFLNGEDIKGKNLMSLLHALKGNICWRQ